MWQGIFSTKGYLPGIVRKSACNDGMAAWVYTVNNPMWRRKVPLPYMAWQAKFNDLARDCGWCLDVELLAEKDAIREFRCSNLSDGRQGDICGVKFDPYESNTLTWRDNFFPMDIKSKWMKQSNKSQETLLTFIFCFANDKESSK